jgi:hypothetical protein
LNHGGAFAGAKGIVLHETANPGGSAQMHYQYFNNADRQASAHAFVDWKEIVQLVPWNERAWHAGRTANSSYLGIELCRPVSHDPVKFQEVWNRGTWLFDWLFLNVLKVNKVTKDNLMSHAEVSMKWHETDHMDPVSYFSEYGKTVDGFRNDVQKLIDAVIRPPVSIVIDGKPLTMDVPAQIINGRVCAPVRFIAEALGKTVTWDNSTKTATIK